MDFLHFDPKDGVIPARAPVQRFLSDLESNFADRAAYRARLNENPLIYRVTSIEDYSGAGQLHYGLGVLMPGKIGREYFMTKGHLHTWRPAAEVYIGLRGRGLMVLEDERTGECRVTPLEANTVVYVPGWTAHRTVNIGEEPLVYWGIFPCEAGHDYDAIGERNFRIVVIEKDGAPLVMERSAFLRELEAQAL
ncbi:MAG: cupin domain-containing protein [Caldilinea sp.]|nr:cupin domain-containing protein [Caldilinea sp.]MDW8439315.1 glucose-6-phosphate isomerase family protein [Caldilineaceae bacterium]